MQNSETSFAFRFGNAEHYAGMFPGHRASDQVLG